MGTKKENTKRKLLETTIKLLEEYENPKDITVRRIADTAGIGVGLVNYHFISRDKLINEAISQKMRLLASDMEYPLKETTDPISYLKQMLIIMSDLAVKNSKLNKVSAEYELLNGDFSICLTLLPILGRIYDNKKSESEIRLIAFQIIVATQNIYIRQEAFYLYSGINIGHKEERDALLIELVDNIIKSNITPHKE